MSRKGWLLFASLCLIWGIPYLFIRVAVQEMSPATLVFFRTLPAALILTPVALHRRQFRALKGSWLWVIVYGLVEVAVPWILLSHAEQRITSSLAGLLIAMVPLIGVVLYRLAGVADHLDGRRLIGLAIGFAGVAALVGLDLGGGQPWAVSEVCAVAMCYATGPLIISRRLAELPGLAVISSSLVLTAAIYAPLALTHLPVHVSAATVGSIAGLSVVCTALAFILFFALILEVGPARATVITYVNPLVAVLLGVALLSEPFTVGIAVGLPLILAGSILGTAPPLRRGTGGATAGPHA